MEALPITQKRIRDKAPYRKSMSMTENDLMRASELERIFTSRFPSEAPFNFSKTISKALELAILQMLQPEGQLPIEIQQTLTGLPADPGALQERQEQKREFNQQKPKVTRLLKKVQKRK